MNSSTLLSSTSLVLRTLIAASSRNWLRVWVSIELNLIRFIPILITSKSYLEAEGSTKYFLSQALGSSLLLFSAYAIYSFRSIILIYVLIIAVLIKLGRFPCHFWFPSVIISTRWVACLILSTWQKIAPLTILTFFLITKFSRLFIILGIINALTGGIIGLNQSQLRGIIAYSSINHMGWILRLLIIDNKSISILYFFIYSSLAIPIFLLFNSISSSSTKNINKIISSSPKTKLIIIILLLALGGLPPINGFIAKILVLFFLINNWLLPCLVIIIGSLFTLYFYLNICISLILDNKTIVVPLPHIPVSSLLLSLSGLFLLPVLLFTYAMTLLYKS